MVHGAGVQGFDEAEVIRDRRRVREEIRRVFEVYGGGRRNLMTS